MQKQYEYSELLECKDITLALETDRKEIMTFINGSSYYCLISDLGTVMAAWEEFKIQKDNICNWSDVLMISSSFKWKLISESGGEYFLQKESDFVGKDCDKCPCAKDCERIKKHLNLSKIDGCQDIYTIYKTIKNN